MAGKRTRPLRDVAPGATIRLPYSGLDGTLLQRGLGGAVVRWSGRSPEVVSAGTEVLVIEEPRTVEDLLQ